MVLPAFSFIRIFCKSNGWCQLVWLIGKQGEKNRSPVFRMCSQAIQIIVKYHVNFLLYCKNKGVIPLINCVQVITWVHNLLDPKSFFFSPLIQLTIIMFCFALTISLDFPVLNALLFFIFLPPTSFSLLSQL